MRKILNEQNYMSETSINSPWKTWAMVDNQDPVHICLQLPYGTRYSVFWNNQSSLNHYIHYILFGVGYFVRVSASSQTICFKVQLWTHTLAAALTNWVDRMSLPAGNHFYWKSDETFAIQFSPLFRTKSTVSLFLQYTFDILKEY